MNVRFGVDTLVDAPWPVAGRRIGLITNASAVTSSGVPTWKALRGAPNVRLIRLFGPEHGIAALWLVCDGAIIAGLSLVSARRRV